MTTETCLTLCKAQDFAVSLPLEPETIPGVPRRLPGTYMLIRASAISVRWNDERQDMLLRE